MPLRSTVLRSLAASASLLPATLAAQSLRPSGTGFSLSAAASLAQVTTDLAGRDASSGSATWRADVQYGVTPRLALVGALSVRASAQAGDALAVRSVDLGVRYLARAGAAVRPFAEAGFGVRRFSTNTVGGVEVSAQNTGPWAAAGVLALVQGHWAVEGAATYGAVRFENWRAGGVAPVLQPVNYREVGARLGVRYFVRVR
ncbi:MAG: hypothetical protein ACK54K_14615 [Gemmatimonadaceae bacterium]